MRKNTFEQYTAVILAAGRGSRISDLVTHPKCLLPIGGETLLERNFKIWMNLGIKKVNLVLGYEKQQILEVCQKYEDNFDFTFYYNDDYIRQGNTFSLYLGIKDLNNPCLIFDADLAYEEAILENFLKNGEKSELLVGEGSLSDIESTKTLVDETGLIRKTVEKRAVSEEELNQYDFVGEATGILKFSTEDTNHLSNLAKEFLNDSEKLHLNWEHLLNEFFHQADIGSYFFDQGKWIEIDTPEDYREAQGLFL